MRVPILLAVVVAAASPARADPPVAPAVVQARPGELATFEVKIEPGKELGRQDVFDPAALTVVRLYSDDPSTFAFMAQPKAAGWNAIVLWTVGEKRGTVVRIGSDPAPAPKPAPGPAPVDPVDPAPSPAPTAPRVIVVLCDETRDRTPAQAAVMFDPAARKRLTGAGHQIQYVEASDPAFAPFGKALGSVPLPAVVVMDAAPDADGKHKVLDRFALPGTAAELESRVGKAVKP